MSTYEETAPLFSKSREDKELFDEIYMRYWEKLFLIANKHLKDPEAAEDIVHDIFLSLWNNRKKVKVNQLEHYLVTAVKYQVLTQIKKRSYAQKYVSYTAMAGPARLAPEISDAVHNRRILELVYKEIDLLPEKCKLIFQYSREEGMTSKEIAEILNISKKTVDNQIHKALEHLKFKFRHIFSIFFF